MQIDFKKLAASVAKIVVPIAAVLVVQKITTGKADVKGVLRDAAEKEIGPALGADGLNQARRSVLGLSD